MKRSISLLSALTFVLVFSSNSFGQAVTASANVLSEISYTAESDLNFGTFTTNMSAATIDPTGTGGDSNNLNGTAGTDYTAGRYLVTGQGSQNVTVTLDNSQVTLAHATSSDDMTLAATLSSASGTQTTDRGGSTFTSGNEVTLSSGNATVWIGGTLTPNDNDGTAGMAAGTYENTTELTLTVDYAL